MKIEKKKVLKTFIRVRVDQGMTQKKSLNNIIVMQNQKVLKPGQTVVFQTSDIGVELKRNHSSSEQLSFGFLQNQEVQSP